jgi:hypothetical protein
LFFDDHGLAMDFRKAPGWKIFKATTAIEIILIIILTLVNRYNIRGKGVDLQRIHDHEDSLVLHDAIAPAACELDNTINASDHDCSVCKGQSAKEKLEPKAGAELVGAGVQRVSVPEDLEEEIARQ